MDENKVVETIHGFIDSTFPKTCPNCGMAFNSLAEYLRNSTNLGDPISYDAEEGDWKPDNPIGTASFSNCKCGSTIALTSKGMNLWTLWRLMLWAKTESRKRGISTSELLRNIRDEIDRRALSGDD
jgi:hypothetical protein